MYCFDEYVGLYGFKDVVNCVEVNCIDGEVVKVGYKNYFKIKIIELVKYVKVVFVGYGNI